MCITMIFIIEKFIGKTLRYMLVIINHKMNSVLNQKFITNNKHMNIHKTICVYS